jgi:hypothetical protein
MHEFTDNGRSVSQTIHLTSDDVPEWVYFREEPWRFIPQIFDGDWGNETINPIPGEAMILRILRDRNGFLRTVIRQGDSLYAFPHG